MRTFFQWNSWPQGNRKQQRSLRKCVCEREIETRENGRGRESGGEVEEGKNRERKNQRNGI